MRSSLHTTALCLLRGSLQPRYSLGTPVPLLLLLAGCNRHSVSDIVSCCPAAYAHAGTRTVPERASQGAGAAECSERLRSWRKLTAAPGRANRIAGCQSPYTALAH